MEGLPFLPGNAFKDPTQTNFHLSHTLDVKDGLRYAKSFPEIGIGGRPLKVNQLTENELDELANFQPTLTYGKTKQSLVTKFVPAHVALCNKVLRFYGYFKETVNESPAEHYRVRLVQIFYFLEDDSMLVTEPSQNNSGIPQGKLVCRHRIPKNDVGDCYNWRDLNLGISLAIYGRVYRITNCDKFTKEFLESEGVIVNEPEREPIDPYLAERSRREAIVPGKTPSTFDKRRQYLELDRKVLRFYAVHDERHEMFGECRKFIIHYYLADDTLEIREIHTVNDGRDPFPLLLRREKIPKCRDAIPQSFPIISMEITENEVKEYFSPKDFHIGQSVNILGRKYLIYDCDNFTKAWYHNNFGLTEFTPIDVEIKQPELPKKEIPPYNGYGTIEDSLVSTKSFILKPPKVDFAKQVDYAQKVLRYEARLDSVRPEDASRRFIISYRLSDDMISIFETPMRNSGFPGGSFLKRSRVAKPGCLLDNPIYYGPTDFSIGSKIDIFGTRFIITDADEYVIKFLESNRDQFSDELINCFREHLTEKENQSTVEQQLKSKRSKGHHVDIRREEGDIENVMNEVRVQLKKMAITDKCRIDDMFLTYNKDRHGCINSENLKDMCKKIHIPPDDDILQALLDKYGTDGKMSLEQFGKFFELP
ncbi:EF-hand domain-containing protein 1 [Schistosoma japonicum]|nr:EF-hand domain-containing protein 1 [Schistosoma japonicum]